MTSRVGNAGLLGRKPTLEERIETQLLCTPSRAQLKNDYTDPADRQNVRNRALIAAVLDACFEHGFPDNETDSIEITTGQDPEVWSELASARRAFCRDANYLNNGRKAESCLSPIPQESIIPKNTIGEDRELLIIWLATVELWDNKRDHKRFKSQKAIFDIAAEACDTTVSSYRTHRSEMKKSLRGEGTRFSAQEQEFYQSLISEAKSTLAATIEGDTAFNLLFPAALACSEQKSPTRLSANKLKG